MSKHGTTARVAKKIADLLPPDTTQLVNIQYRKINPEEFGRVIIGTPIYAGNADKQIRQFCRRNRHKLEDVDVALFACGMEPDFTLQQQELFNAFPPDLFQQARTKAFLGGEFLFDKMSFFEKLIIRKIKKVDTHENIHDIKDAEIEQFVRAL